MNLATVAGRAEEKIQRIDEQIAQLIAQKNELEEQQSLNQSRSIFVTFFFQAPPSLAFKIESIRLQIASLEHQRDRLYDIIKQSSNLAPFESQFADLNQSLSEIKQRTIPVPRDWSNYPLYSKTLQYFDMNYPSDQFGFYAATFTATWYVSKKALQSWYTKKAAHAIAKGRSDDTDVFIHRAGLSDEKHVVRAMKSRHRTVGIAAAIGVGAVAMFTTLVRWKNRSK